MDTVITIVLGLCSLVVLGEAVRRLDDFDLSACFQHSHTECVLQVLRTVAWLSLLIGAPGVALAGQLDREFIMLGYALMVVGSACLVLRTWISDELAKKQKRATASRHIDPFDRTQVVDLRSALPASMAIEDASQRAKATVKERR